MSRNNDPLGLSPHWHLDLRLEAELPEDTIVGVRFLVNTFSSVVVLFALFFAGKAGLQAWHLRTQIQETERRINEIRSEVKTIEDTHQEYMMEAQKIDQAHTLVRPPLLVSRFVAGIGRTRPEQMFIDLLEWTENTVVLRGGLQERSERASRLLGGYVETLRKDEQIGPLFQSIQLTNIDRGTSGGPLRFEIRFALKEQK